MPENSVGINQPDTKKTGSNKVIILIGIAVIILLLIVIVILLLRKPAGSTGGESPAAQASQETKREVLVNEENVQEIIEQIELDNVERNAPGLFTAQMNFEWHFADGEAESRDSYVANAIENTNDIYFDLYLADDLENTIYESPVIPVGQVLRNVKLSKQLSAGTYETVLEYHLLDEDQNTLSTASFAVTIIVEN